MGESSASAAVQVCAGSLDGLRSVEQVLVSEKGVSPQEVAHVAVLGHLVVLDRAALKVMGSAFTTAAPPAAPAAPLCPVASSLGGGEEVTLPVPVIRAALFIRLAGLMMGRSGVTPDAAVFLTELLNRNITPVVRLSCEETTDGCSLSFLGRVFAGEGECYDGEGQSGSTRSLREVLSQKEVQLPIHVDLETVMEAPSVLSNACLALSISSLETLVDVSDCTSALLLESLKASSEFLFSNPAEVCRPQKGLVTTLSNLRSLVEGSSLVKKSRGVASKPKRRSSAPASAPDVPQAPSLAEENPRVWSVCSNLGPVSGLLRDILAQSRSKLLVELRAAELGSASQVRNLAAQFDTRLQKSISVALLDAVLEVVSLKFAEAQLLMEQGESSSTVPELRTELEDLQSQFEELSAHGKGGRFSLSLGASRSWAHAWQLFRSVGALEKLLGAFFSLTHGSLHLAEHKLVQDVLKRLEGKPIKRMPELKLGQGSAQFRQLTRPENLPEDESCFAVFLEHYSSRCGAFDLGFRQILETVLRSASSLRRPKNAKGTRDYGPSQMAIRENAINIITSVFKLHGAVTIDTPVFERKETLTGKYGEDSKLIYDLADQGGELLSLRYDLTVPFARYVAQYGVSNIKRYQIAKVYRRDNPAMKSGRYREFYQCDFDIAGPYGRMIPDAEVVKVMVDILSALNIGQFTIKINHRLLLDAIMGVCGVPSAKFRSICSAIDKLDKLPWEQVREEMVSAKGLLPEVADRIHTFVEMKGTPFELLASLRDVEALSSNEQAVQAFGDMELFFGYLEAMGCLEQITFDMSLARGLDYYTGVIFEAIFLESDLVGSIAAGGRYDKLVGMFSQNSKDIPAVGCSIGMERVFTLMEVKEAKLKTAGTLKNGTRASPSLVFVAQAGRENFLLERMRIAKLFWDAGIPCEFAYTEKTDIKRQLKTALDAGIPVLVTIGEDEVRAGTAYVKNLFESEESRMERKRLGGREVDSYPLPELVPVVRTLLEEIRCGELEEKLAEESSSQ